MNYRKTFCGKGNKRGCGIDMFVPIGSRIKLCNDCWNADSIRCDQGVVFSAITENNSPEMFDKLNTPYLPRVKTYREKVLEKEKLDLMEFVNSQKKRGL